MKSVSNGRQATETIRTKSVKDTAQKAKELNWLFAFREKCADCPRSIPGQPKPPAPDLIFPESDLGIEVTEYLLGQGKAGSHPRRLESVRRRIVQTAQSEYEKNISHCLQVLVIWATTDCPSNDEEKTIVEALVRLVMIQTSGNGRLWRIGWEQFDEPVLQKYVAEVSISLIGDTGPSCWGNSAAFWLWDVKKRVQVILNEKEPKVSTYRKFCNKVWLLIVADRSWFSSKLFPDQNFAKATFSSSFDRAFLFDEASSLVYKLRIER
jgi:hypothetical protein